MRAHLVGGFAIANWGNCIRQIAGKRHLAASLNLYSNTDFPVMNPELVQAWLAAKPSEEIEQGEFTVRKFCRATRFTFGNLKPLDFSAMPTSNFAFFLLGFL